ncbi:Recombination inhibitory protein MutS2 [hydrothermal vent metagenome]|uniref:Recombination inhibitory protein MutS2 n=1 Tax=hydrothermal vent metagenome TaxID=652676 RepID=A0A3B1CPW1_9ZZZZ
MIADKVISILEFEKILQKISKYSITEFGKENLLKLTPKSKISEAVKFGNYVTEAKEALIQTDIPPLEYLPDLIKSISNSRIEGAILTIKQIKDIDLLAAVSRRLKKYLKTSCQETKLNSDFSHLLFSDISFEKQIERIFTESGDIRDDASPQLKKIRTKINEKGEALRKTVNSILKRLSNSMLVQEEYITQRDGRIVLPVKAEHKRHVKGFIHSESATGQTIYIEPEESLELNNELLSLNFAERREVERILKQVTDLIGRKSDELKLSLEVISEVDTFFAIANYSMEIIGVFPSLNENEPFKIIDARHPLLIQKIGRKNTVPLDLEIKDDKIIVITGPNAGGKTVVLKTVGVLSLLVMSGIHIPTHADSNFWFFDNIAADIGDQQSIEDDLSTFSSHLMNINEILKTSDSKTLVLLDELGTGTDPAEGAALAAAILLKLHEKGSTVFATTHHGDLKILANDQEGFLNASMIYDIEKLEPTYKFRLGVPGSSYAFEVARRIGIDDAIIEIAKENLDEDKNRIEEFLIELEAKSNKIREKLNEYERENSRLKGLTNLYQSKIKFLENEKKTIILNAKAKADEYLKNINKEVEQTIKRIKETNAERSVIVEEKKKISELKKENENIAKNDTEELEPVKLYVGDFVKIKDTTTEGEIISINGDVAQIVSGKIKLRAKLNKLRKTKQREQVVLNNYRNYTAASPEIRIDIRGKKPEEVEYQLLRFLDNAYANNLSKVEIVHGKGTGVLKETVHHILKKHEGVKDFEFAKIELGGEGVTIVSIK